MTVMMMSMSGPVRHQRSVKARRRRRAKVRQMMVARSPSSPTSPLLPSHPLTLYAHSNACANTIARGANTHTHTFSTHVRAVEGLDSEDGRKPNSNSSWELRNMRLVRDNGPGNHKSYRKLTSTNTIIVPLDSFTIPYTTETSQGRTGGRCQVPWGSLTTAHLSARTQDLCGPLVLRALTTATVAMHPTSTATIIKHQTFRGVLV